MKPFFFADVFPAWEIYATLGELADGSRIRYASDRIILEIHRGANIPRLA